MSAKEDFNGLLTKIKLESDSDKQKSLVQKALVPAARLETFEREQGLEDLAKFGGISKTALRTSLKEIQAKQNSLGGRPVEPKDVEPWPHEVDGADLLNRLEKFFNRYLVLPTGAARAMAAYALATHAVDAFDEFGYLVFRSPEPEAGKTRALELLELVVRRPQAMVDPTSALISRLVERTHPTLLIDEAETIAAYNGSRKDLIGILNAGYRRGKKAIKNVPAGDGNWAANPPHTAHNRTAPDH